MKHNRNFLRGAFLAAALAVLWGGAALPVGAANNRIVDDDGVECPTFTDSTIGSAVAAATAGSTITVCTGTYTETVLIDTLPKLKLMGKGIPRVIAPPGTDGAIIKVQDSASVTIQGLYIDGGENFSGTSTSMEGIYLEGSSGTIMKNVITRIRRSPAGSSDMGYGIFVSSGTPAPVMVKIINNTIYDVQERGIYVANNVKPTISSNRITGVFDDGSKPYLIFVRGLNGGTITKNILTSRWVPEDSDHYSGGMAIVDSSNMKVSGNTVTNAEVGLIISADTIDASLNKITGNRFIDNFFGIFIGGNGTANSDGNRVTGNRIIAEAYYLYTGSGVHAVIIDPSTPADAVGNVITSNTIQGYTLAFWLDEDGTGTISTPNKISPVPAPGP